MAPWLWPAVTAICAEPHQLFGLPLPAAPPGALREGVPDAMAVEDVLGGRRGVVLADPGAVVVAGVVTGAVAGVVPGADGVVPGADDDVDGAAPAPWPLPDTDALHAASAAAERATAQLAASLRRPCIRILPGGDNSAEATRSAPPGR